LAAVATVELDQIADLYCRVLRHHGHGGPTVARSTTTRLNDSNEGLILAPRSASTLRIREAASSADAKRVTLPVKCAGVSAIGALQPCRTGSDCGGATAAVAEACGGGAGCGAGGAAGAAGGLNGPLTAANDGGVPSE